MSSRAHRERERERERALPCERLQTSFSSFRERRSYLKGFNFVEESKLLSTG
ncbi:Hypothetical predicted protein [Prunus dulcis]|uniref:Uncharacterized protein n=1 Tax=Prunus dulcis TaxID=3755 RepID=A0A5E4F9C2_PRUDU|nr:Hypothetical predicted protein [Prunus dulcis]